MCVCVCMWYVHRYTHGQSVRRVGCQPREEHTGGKTGRGEVRTMLLRARAVWDDLCARGIGGRHGVGSVKAGVSGCRRRPQRRVGAARKREEQGVRMAHCGV